MSTQNLGTPHWSSDEDAQLRRLAGAGPVVLATIARHLSGRSLPAIVARLRRLGLGRHVDLTDYHRSRYRRYRQPSGATDRRWTRWSQHEDALLREAADSRCSLEQLQARLNGRTAVAIVARLRTLGLVDRIAGTLPYVAIRDERQAPRAPKRRRRCLHCGRSFRSAGPQNRLCDPCREYAADISPFDIWP